jgi:hypothetical protein
VSILSASGEGEFFDALSQPASKPARNINTADTAIDDIVLFLFILPAKIVKKERTTK